VETVELAELARLRLKEAGDRAFALSALPAATRFYSAALELWPADDPGRPHLLLRLSDVAVRAGIGDPKTRQEAPAGLLAAGNPDGAAEAEELLFEHFWMLGDRDRGFECLE